MWISLKNIPEWIQVSVKYQNIIESHSDEYENYDENEKIEVSKKLLKKHDGIESINDFKKVYYICNFWIMDYPTTFYLWCIDNKEVALEFCYSELNSVHNLEWRGIWDEEIYKIKELINFILRN